MKYLFHLLIFLWTPIAYSQEVQVLYPSIGDTIAKSPEGEMAFAKHLEECDKILDKAKEMGGSDGLSKTESTLFDECLTEKEGYWDVLGMGCSWYCGGGLDTLTATSELKSYKGISYAASNAHDLSYQTAWVEGVPGYGVGESLTYHFPPENPRITQIIVVNGYIKSPKAWRNNSRVKKLKMYVNGQEFAILNLEDSRAEQFFSFDPLGYADREDWNILKRKPWWTIRFEIVEVYPGDAYDDTAITEIYFDGIDVH